MLGHGHRLCLLSVHMDHKQANTHLHTSLQCSFPNSHSYGRCMACDPTRCPLPCHNRNLRHAAHALTMLVNQLGIPTCSCVLGHPVVKLMMRVALACMSNFYLECGEALSAAAGAGHSHAQLQAQHSNDTNEAVVGRSTPSMYSQAREAELQSTAGEAFLNGVWTVCRVEYMHVDSEDSQSAIQRADVWTKPAASH